MTSTTEVTSDNSNGVLHASRTETQAVEKTVPEQTFPEGATSEADEAEKKPAKKAAPRKSAAKKAAPRKSAAKKAAPRKSAAKKTRSDGDAQPTAKRQRRTRLFPAATFEDAVELATAIYTVGAGQLVRRITLFDTLGKSPDSGPTRQLVTNCAKYGLSTGSYAAEFLELTPDGLQAVADNVTTATRIRARFKLAIGSVEVFKTLYDTYLGNRLPAQAVLMDKAREAGIPEEDLTECVETFTLNTKFVGVLRSISGAERLLSIDTVIDDFSPGAAQPTQTRTVTITRPIPTTGPSDAQIASYETACFYISPIGEEGSEQRKHADLFMGALVEPALSEFNLRLVRADQIGEAGMITGQIIEHIVHSKLVIVDLSFHNPNVFYELALRHAVRRPIVQISRAADKLPFDVGQVRTIVVDTTDIYTLVPQLESFKASIAAQIRKTLDQSSEVENPLSIFAPTFWQYLPSPQ